MSVTRTGDWAGLLRRLKAIPDNVDRAVKRATLQNCQGFVKEIKQGISDQAPGGVPFKPLHPYTVLQRLAGLSAARREQVLAKLSQGKVAKALIRHGDLVRSITYKISKDGWSGAVGVNRQAVSQDGRHMVDIARVLFKGKTILVTPKMRAYLHYTGLHLSPNTTHISIPPRDPITPTYRKYKAVMVARYRTALTEAMGLRAGSATGKGHEEGEKK